MTIIRIRDFRAILMLTAALFVVSCSKDDEKDKPGKTEVTKIADYLYEYTAEGYNPEAPSELLFDDGPIPVFGCSAVRNGNFYGRNLDFNINEILNLW